MVFGTVKDWRNLLSLSDLLSVRFLVWFTGQRRNVLYADDMQVFCQEKASEEELKLGALRKDVYENRLFKKRLAGSAPPTKWLRLVQI